MDECGIWFEEQLQKIKGNDPECTNPDLSFVEFNDFTAQALGDALMDNTQPLELSVQIGDGFTEQGAENLAKGLQGSRIVKFELECEGIIDPDAKKIILHALQSIESLQELLLNVALDDSDARLLWRSLKNKPLELFSFQLSPNTTEQGRNALAAICDNSTTVEMHPVSHGMSSLQDDDPPIPSSVQNPFHQSILQGQDFQSLKVKDTSIGDIHQLTASLVTLEELELNRCLDVSLLQHTEQLSWGLRFANQLKILRLHNCAIGDAEIRTLCQGLHKNNCIRELSWKGNQISDDGVATFVRMWPRISPIKRLSLSSNDITVVGARLLLTAASTHPELATLDISHNPRIGYSGLQRLAIDSVPQVEIRELDLSACGRSRFEHLAADQVLARQRASDAMLEGVRANDHLISLTFDEGEIVPRVQHEINALLLPRNQR